MNASDPREPALAAASKPEFSAAEIGALAHLIEVKSTEALSGARALTARPTGRW